MFTLTIFFSFKCFLRVVLIYLLHPVLYTYCILWYTEFAHFLAAWSCVADPGSGVLLTPGSGSGMENNLDRYSGWICRIIFLRAYEHFYGLNILKFFVADPESWIFFDPGTGIRDGKIPIRDPDFYPSRIPDLGSRIPDPGSRIPDPGSKNR